jgi:DNA-binding transcriptional MerR regulator
MHLARPPLPDKDFFNMGEACRIVQVPPYTLRYWERQFRALRPVRRESGHRRYTRRDLETILEIKELLQDRRMTVEGARKALIHKQPGRAQGNGVEGPLPVAAAKILREVREDLRKMLDELQ